MTAKVKLCRDAYIAELNRQLRLHEDYQDGMAFLPYPDGSTGNDMMGYSITGPPGLTAVFSQIAHKVDGEVDVT